MSGFVVLQLCNALILARKMPPLANSWWNVSVTICEPRRHVDVGNFADVGGFPLAKHQTAEVLVDSAALMRPKVSAK